MCPPDALLAGLPRPIMSAVPDALALLSLLSAPKKSAIDEFLCSCAVEREQLSVSAARIAEIAATFGSLSTEDARRLQRAGAALVNEAVYIVASAPEQVAVMLGDGFHADLGALISKVVLHRVEEWRAESLALGGVSSMPRYERCSWEVYRKPDAASPSMLLNLSLNNGSSSEDAGYSNVQIEMSKEQLEAMLESLRKVKDQLEKV